MPVILIANKCDLENNLCYLNHDNQYYFRNKKIQYYKCSAINNFNINYTFNKIITFWMDEFKYNGMRSYEMKNMMENRIKNLEVNKEQDKNNDNSCCFIM